VDFVDEQHVVLLEIGQQCGQVLGLFQHRAAGLAQVHAQLVGNDVRQRGLAQARRAEQQHVVQRLVTLFGGTDKDLQLLAHLGLAHIFVEQLGRRARSMASSLLDTGAADTTRGAGGGAAKSSVSNAHNSGLSKQKKQETPAGCPL